MTGRLQYAKVALAKILDELVDRFPLVLTLDDPKAYKILGLPVEKMHPEMDQIVGNLKQQTTPQGDSPGLVVGHILGWLTAEGYTHTVGKGWVLSKKGLKYRNINFTDD